MPEKIQGFAPRRRGARSKKGGDAFAKDEIVGEYENPGPQTNPDGAAIAKALATITKSESVARGFVANWLPLWVKREGLKAFTFFFFEDKLAVDFFNRDRKEMNALEDDLTHEQRQEIAHKTVLCSKNGIAYLSLGPDDDLDVVQLAAKIGKTTYKKGARSARASTGDGIEEEGNDL